MRRPLQSTYRSPQKNNITTINLKYKTIFKDQKNRKIENKKITEYFSTEMINSNNLILENNSTIIPVKSTSKFQINTDNIKIGIINDTRKQKKSDPNYQLSFESLIRTVSIFLYYYFVFFSF